MYFQKQVPEIHYFYRIDSGVGRTREGRQRQRGLKVEFINWVIKIWKAIGSIRRGLNGDRGWGSTSAHLPVVSAGWNTKADARIRPRITIGGHNHSALSEVQVCRPAAMTTARISSVRVVISRSKLEGNTIRYALNQRILSNMISISWNWRRV